MAINRLYAPPYVDDFTLSTPDTDIAPNAGDNVYRWTESPSDPYTHPRAKLATVASGPMYVDEDAEADVAYYYEGCAVDASGNVTTAVVATGRDFPDALAASGLAGAYGSPVLLVGDTVSATLTD
ncbi:MAG: cell wall-binding repeat-containing protein, partial [Coriobacteriia bacterium]